MDAMAHSLMNPAFPPMPAPRDIGQETRDTMQAMIDYAPRMYGMEAQFRPQYALLDARIMRDVLTGSGGMLDYYENTLLPASMRQASTMRGADISDLEQYGPRATQAILDADPNQRGLLAEMNRQAMSDLKLGGQLSADEARDVVQSTRAGFSDRGMIRSGSAILDEVANRHQYSNARKAQRQDFAGRMVGYNKAVTGDPMMSVLGRPSNAGGDAGQMMAFSGRFPGSGPSEMFNPMNSYASGLYGGNQQAATSMYGSQAGLMGSMYGSNAGLYGSMYGANMGLSGQQMMADANKTSSIIGGLMGGAGLGLGALAAFCWVAREVYGEDNPDWIKFRAWLHASAPLWFFKLYARNGQRVARWIKGKKLIKRAIRAWMDTKVTEVCYAI
jgi:hypothetical protein